MKARHQNVHGVSGQICGGHKFRLDFVPGCKKPLVPVFQQIVVLLEYLISGFLLREQLSEILESFLLAFSISSLSYTVLVFSFLLRALN